MILLSEYPKRPRPDYVDSRLLKPFQSLASIAMARVRNGTVQDDKRQMITLRFEQKHKIYRLVDTEVEKQDEGIISSGDLVAGLFINCIQCDDSGNPVDRYITIQTARDPSLITVDNLMRLRDFPPEKITQIGRELITAVQTTDDQYDTALQMLPNPPRNP